MENVVDKYCKKLNKNIKNYEEKYGNLVENTLKHFFINQHKMIVEDMLFCQPDLAGLEKYEKWLNEGNKKG